MERKMSEVEKFEERFERELKDIWEYQSTLNEALIKVQQQLKKIERHIRND
jgi:septal ring factor EnvC (AmiA/AmiB activator)